MLTYFFFRISLIEDKLEIQKLFIDIKIVKCMSGRLMVTFLSGPTRRTIRFFIVTVTVIIINTK